MVTSPFSCHLGELQLPGRFNSEIYPYVFFHDGRLALARHEVRCSVNEGVGVVSALRGGKDCACAVSCLDSTSCIVSYEIYIL